MSGARARAARSATASSLWCFWLILVGMLPGVARAEPTPFPATAGQSTEVLARTHYVDAHVFLGRYGLQSKWLEPNRRARFSSAWTSIELEADRGQISYNGLKVFLGDAVMLHRGNLWLSRVDAEKTLAPLLKPSTYGRAARPPRTIVVDAGHGGQDTGTRNVALKLDEKDHALDVAQRVAAILQREGYRVMMTRDDDRFIPLPERAAFCNRAAADLFVSIHFNAAVPGVQGVETYVLTPQHQRSTGQSKVADTDRDALPGHRADAWSTIVGYQIHRQLLERLKAPDRGLKRARFVVLREVECPAVLVEAGYLSNEAEARKIATPEYRSAIAEGIAAGIAAYASQAVAATRR